MGETWRAPGRIPNAPLREAVLASDVELRDICVSVGLVRHDQRSESGDTTALKRFLGLTGTPCRSRASGTRSVSVLTTIDAGRAKGICDAIRVDFDELYPDAPDSVKPCGVNCGICESPLLNRAQDGLCNFCREETELFGSVAA